ncbi:lysozyme [Bosea sp. LjRoot237]|uniref:lysozyme n=1 Tax=Bosea sp. LjRoot237 TaxID=3342292 RepID=UPI003ECFE2A5
MSKRAKVALASVAGAIALATTALIQPWEGLVLTSHWDRYAKIWDICYGETKGITSGMVKTKAECEAMLTKRVYADFYIPLTRCISGFADKPKSWQATTISLAYNVGTGAVCKSTAAKFAREGDYKQSCQAMTRFNRAGGQVVGGLVKRREYGDAERMGELELCLAGL